MASIEICDSSNAKEQQFRLTKTETNRNIQNQYVNTTQIREDHETKYRRLLPQVYPEGIKKTTKQLYRI